MDELPELLVEAVGDDRVVDTVDLGGDFVTVTPRATHLYRSEGLLSDESVETFEHDVDQLSVDPGRRKDTVLLESIDEESSLTVPSSVVDAVLEAMLEGVLRTTGVLDEAETIEAQFRFSELTLVVTDEQLLKHIGSAVWNDEYEAYRYEDLTNLEFEEGSVATQVVVEAAGRQQRVKVPNENAGRVRQAVQSAVFKYHEVSSLGGLRDAVGTEDEEGAESGDEDHEPDEDAEDGGEDDGSTEADDGFVSADWSPPADQDINASPETAEADADEAGSATESTSELSTAESSVGEPTVDGDPDVDALAERVDALAERVDYQTELLERQEETIEQLVEELRRGR